MEVSLLTPEQMELRCRMEREDAQALNAAFDSYKWYIRNGQNINPRGITPFANMLGVSLGELTQIFYEDLSDELKARATELGLKGLKGEPYEGGIEVGDED